LQGNGVSQYSRAKIEFSVLKRDRSSVVPIDCACLGAHLGACLPSLPAGDLQADAMKQANNLARFWSAIASD
jgi:hypothetical protein